MRELFFLLLCSLLISQHSTSESGANSSHPNRYQNFQNETEFMSDSRFGRGGSATSSSSSWTFSPTTARSRIVETKYGRVQGLSVTLFTNIHYTGNRNFPLKNKIVEIFFSIPYAAPPIKSHRFSPTQTPIPWNDVRPAIQPSAVCPQIFPEIRNESMALREMPKGYLEYLRRVEPYLRNQSEDCLYLNIFSPIGPDAKLKPVVVYIHGGMFAWGSGNLSDGTVLAAYADVIFVSLNYRLNILGFLNLNESPSTRPRVANYGLMDQIAALHWIKENIRAFGGDPENITLMGYEAGAACINFLMASPTVTPGLFQRSILIAGSSHAPWALISEPSVAAFSVAQALNCSSANSTQAFYQEMTTTTSTTVSPPSRDTHHFGIGAGAGAGSSSSLSMEPVMDCLKTKHYSEFTKFTLPKFSLDFGPSVDGIVIKPNFRTNLPPQMGKREVSKKYDVLFGLSSLERLTEFSEMDLEFGFESVRRDAILRTLVRNSYRYHRNEILATITNEYIDWERTAQHPISTRDMAVNAVTDCLSLAPVVAVADSSQIRKSYFYIFEHSTKDGLYNYHRAGAGGGEELHYMFGYPLVEAATGQVLPFIPAPLPSNYSKGEIALAELWMNFISNFAHSGNPNGPLKIDSISSWPVSKERNRYKNTAWEPYDRLHQKYLEIGANKIRTRSHYRAHQMAIWLRLVPELQRSGAQMASSFHNKMRGGNDPALYTGRLKQPEEDLEDSQDLGGTSPLNSALLYDLLLGYGYNLLGYDNGGGVNSVGESQPVPEPVETEELTSTSGRDDLKKNSNPRLTLTTCYSPVSSSVQEGTFTGSGSGGGKGSNETSFFDPKHFPPYSLILAVTIAVGCSLLILNISIFALVYFQRDRKRAKLLKSQDLTDLQHQDSEDPSNPNSNSTKNKYLEPPELLKSNRTTQSSFLHSVHSSNNSNINLNLSTSHSQAEIEALELTVKQHQQELMGERALLYNSTTTSNSNSNSGSSTLLGSVRQGQSFPKLPHSFSSHTLPREYYLGGGESTVESSSPSQSQSQPSPSNSNQSQQNYNQTLAVATLPRCNGALGLGLSSFIGGGGANKPNPPPRSGQGPLNRMNSLRRGQRVEYGDNCNSDSNNENDELKV